ncbi:hypothetical protein [Dehalobacter sp. CF]|uniref:hypothetical protein n=1 Tax=Dehalobacter sp. CF TaxID=1131462 RepID=UPI00028BB0E2|nr:hypothetical protein [Dehalobacter sp. CF]AFV05408.1 hypothetical protein DCF50_p1402 [Dehalobacter sp. CF]
MKNTEVLYLKELCSQFRNAIIIYGIKKLPISFHAFPMGSCGDTSLLLGKYLDEMELGQFNYVCGQLGRQSHAWLEKDGIIVDITADQFDDATEEIIVTDNNDFHKRFEEKSRRLYIDSFGNSDFVDIELLPAYYKIIGCIDDKYKPV